MWMPSDSNGSWVAHAEAHMLRYEVEVLVDRPPLSADEDAAVRPGAVEHLV